MSYGPDFADGFRQAGVYVGKILKGEKPTNMPVAEPTKYELIINLKTAKALGITRVIEYRLPMVVVDAVDGSSTGTRVPQMWALLRLP